jgi:hypothetical protein
MRRLISAELLLDTNGTTTCSLCKLYYKNDCLGCPVAEKTGKDFCKLTPYVDYDRALEGEDAVALREAAHAEVEFLASLTATQLSASTAET